MATYNHKIKVTNGNTTDVFHPETNSGQVYDFTNDKWLSSVIGVLNTLSTTQKSSIVASINEIANVKAPLVSPTFTGTPQTPTAAVGTNTTQIANTAFVSRAIANIPPNNGIDVVDEIPTDLVGKSIFFKKQGSVSNAPNKPTIQNLTDMVESKADISYVNQKVQAAALTFKESYATLTALQTAYPNGNNFNHVVLADGTIHTWANGAWVNTQIQANGTGIADLSITPQKTTFFGDKKAIDAEFFYGYDIANSTGDVVSGTSNVTWDLVPVEPNTTYFLTQFSKIAFFKQDGSFKNVGIYTLNNDFITTDNDVYFIRLRTDLSNTDNYVFAKSDKPLSYEESHKETLKAEILPSFLTEDLSLLKSYYNEKLAIDVTFTPNTQLINSTGGIVGGGEFTSNIVAVEPNTTYFMSNHTKLAYFTANENFKQIEIVTKNNALVTTDNDVRFIRIQTSNPTKYVLAKSDTVLTYEEANSNSIKQESIPKLPYSKIYGLDNIIGTKKHVACYGDSLTEGAGSTNAGVYSYPSQLWDMINASNNNEYTVSNRGVGGEDTFRIMVRQGAYADYVEPFTIPATTTAVAITKATKAGENGIKNGVNPVTIKGVEGTLSFTNGTFYFTRSVAGSSVVVDRPTPIIRASAKQDKDKIQIFFMGQNFGYDDLDEFIVQHKRMIDYLGHNKFLIIGLTSGTATSRLAMEKRMETAFGVNYINMRKYLVRFGLADSGLTPTQADITAIEDGSIPPQILADNVHLTNNGYFSIAKAVYARGQELGFWK